MEKSETYNPRKSLIGLILKIFLSGILWFLMLAGAVMETDSCESTCYPGDDMIMYIAGYAFPIVSLITLILTSFAYSRDNHESMKKYIKFGGSLWWAFTPVIYIIVGTLFEIV